MTVNAAYVAAPMNPVLVGKVALDQVLNAVGGWVTVSQTEHTKRVAIAGREAVALAEIAAKRDVFLTYLDRSFDERADAFSRLFDALDRELAKGSTDLGPILGAITTLAAKSPFADLHDIELVKASLANPDHEWVV